MSTLLRADGRLERRISRRFGRYRLGVTWLPPKLYTRAEVGYYRDVEVGVGAVHVIGGRVGAGWSWGPKQ